MGPEANSEAIPEHRCIRASAYGGIRVEIDPIRLSMNPESSCGEDSVPIKSAGEVLRRRFRHHDAQYQMTVSQMY